MTVYIVDLCFQKEKSEEAGWSWDLNFNKEYDFCAGKKTQFPKEMMSFKRVRKGEKKYQSREGVSKQNRSH